jgi:DNA-binding response OmpR family regulator
MLIGWPGSFWGWRVGAAIAEMGSVMSQRILVVDDEPQIRDLLSVYLIRQGYQVSTAASSQETLELLGREPVDMVVLDIGLADEDGLKLLEDIKKRQPNVRVVMLTGMGFVEDLLQEAHEKGADGYVSKIVPLDELLTAIRRGFGPSPLLQSA